ncbi:MAG: acyl-[acyl-carrier-protein]--UDP-N-acetylglucosamine O-acyltransferase [Gammaproteobacteria bacterium RIFCSPLOWO2_02_FULL_38_11]|nr:MAG: acyl-[acyl-carrier-protein]--UDP-N-acetylglucosamine O-acyltransferase [Gammaproteobacteria bacterium RIFCSPLOWO2_02_FULL_38_11]
MIHPTTVIHPDAKIEKNVEIGPWTIIGPHVEIGENTWIGPHVVIRSHTKIGPNNKIYQFSSIGEDPQDLTYKGEPTWLIMGEGNTVREFCTLHRGTPSGRQATHIGNHNLFMAYTHIAHDCKIANNTIFINNAALAGHVSVEDFAIVGSFSAVHQLCRIGAHSFIARATMVSKDVLPFTLISGYDATTYGLNTRGLKRRGFSDATISTLKKAYNIIFRQGNTVDQAIDQLRLLVETCPEVNCLISALQDSERGIVR